MRFPSSAKANLLLSAGNPLGISTPKKWRQQSSCPNAGDSKRALPLGKRSTRLWEHWLGLPEPLSAPVRSVTPRAPPARRPWPRPCVLLAISSSFGTRYMPGPGVVKPAGAVTCSGVPWGADRQTPQGGAGWVTGEGARWPRAEGQATSVLTAEWEHPPRCPAFSDSLAPPPPLCAVSAVDPEVLALVFQAPRLSPFSSESTCPWQSHHGHGGGPVTQKPVH